MKILALDTATELCSVALLIDGTLIAREIETERGHAEHVLPMIDGVLAEAGIAPSGLDAIAFGRGPGGFTGVRLAASVTQGLAFGARVPVIPISDLSATAQRAFDLDPRVQHVLVCNDARMQEVYWGCFERSAEGLATLTGSEHVGPSANVSVPSTWAASVAGAGHGFRIYSDLKERVAQIFCDLLPRASEIARLAAPRCAAGLVVAPEEAIPIYLRDDVAKAAS